MDFQCTLFDITSRLIVWAVYYPLSSGIASGVGTAGTVTWHLHLTLPCGLFNIAVFLVAQKVGSPKTQKFHFQLPLVAEVRLLRTVPTFNQLQPLKLAVNAGSQFASVVLIFVRYVFKRLKDKKMNSIDRTIQTCFQIYEYFEGLLQTSRAYCWPYVIQN